MKKVFTFLILIQCIVWAPRAMAQGAVVVAADIPAEAMHATTMAQWAQKLTQMNQQIQQYTQMTELSRSMQQMAGDIRQVTGAVFGPANQLMDRMRMNLNIGGVQMRIDAANPTQALTTDASYFGFRIGEYIQSGTNYIMRDKTKYKGVAAEQTLIDDYRLASASQEVQEKSEAAQLAWIQSQLASGGQNEAQVTALKAAIEESKARVELTRAQTERTAADAATMEAERDVEELKLRIATAEVAEIQRKEQAARANRAFELSAQKLW